MKKNLKSFFSKSENGSVLINKNTAVFLLCLLISFFCWFLIKLTGEFEDSVQVKVEYYNIPKGKVLKGKLPDTARVSLKGSGYDFIKRYFKSNKDVIRVDCKRLKLSDDSVHFVEVSSQLEKINAEFSKGLLITSFSPDSIFFPFASGSSVKVKVMPVVILKLSDEYRLSDSISTTPSHIVVYGPKERIKNIRSVQTELLTIQDQKNPTQQKVALKKIFNGIAYSNDSVTVNIPVDKFTEGSVQVPVTIKNLPKGYRLRVLPEKVTVKYLIGLKQLNAISPDLFTAEIDYNKISSSSSQTVLVEITRHPVFTKQVKSIPERVEFIIRKK